MRSWTSFKRSYSASILASSFARAPSKMLIRMRIWSRSSISASSLGFAGPEALAIINDCLLRHGRAIRATETALPQPYRAGQDFGTTRHGPRLSRSTRSRLRRGLRSERGHPVRIRRSRSLFLHVSLAASFRREGTWCAFRQVILARRFFFPDLGVERVRQ
jgi:hypothetical protein